MKRVLATVAGMAMLGLAGIAQADEASGKIATVDQTMIVLEDGSMYTVSETVSTEGLQPGMEVMVSYEDQGGKMVAMEVKPAQ